MDYAGLIQAMKERESGAPERFQTAFTPLLRYIIAPILSDERDREECLSDVVLKAWDGIGGYEPSKAPFTTWLSALARNAALNRRRSIERRRESGLPDEDIPAPAGSPEQTVLKAEAARAVWDAVGCLSRRDRELFLRKYYYYQSTGQIAAELGLSLRAVEGRLYRIRKRLQDKLGGVYRGSAGMPWRRGIRRGSKSPRTCRASPSALSVPRDGWIGMRTKSSTQPP